MSTTTTIKIPRYNTEFFLIILSMVAQIEKLEHQLREYEYDARTATSECYDVVDGMMDDECAERVRLELDKEYDKMEAKRDQMVKVAMNISDELCQHIRVNWSNTYSDVWLQVIDATKPIQDTLTKSA